jgi:hypothetical protein
MATARQAVPVVQHTAPWAALMAATAATMRAAMTPARISRAAVTARSKRTPQQEEQGASSEVPAGTITLTAAVAVMVARDKRNCLCLLL